MAKRQSVNGSRARHENPIPNASRIGNIVMSSVIGGVSPGTRDLPAELERQVANVFGNIRHDVEAAGGTVDDILKITFWVKDPAKQRTSLNTEWVKGTSKNGSVSDALAMAPDVSRFRRSLVGALSIFLAS